MLRWSISFSCSLSSWFSRGRAREVCLLSSAKNKNNKKRLERIETIFAILTNIKYNIFPLTLLDLSAPPTNSCSAATSASPKTNTNQRASSNPSTSYPRRQSHTHSHAASTPQNSTSTKSSSTCHTFSTGSTCLVATCNS